MIDPIEGKILFYPVVLVPGRSGRGRDRPGPFRWLRPCDTPNEARRLVNEARAEEGATLGFVVKFPERGKPAVLNNYTRPTEVKTAVEKYLMLVDLIAREHSPIANAPESPRWPPRGIVVRPCYAESAFCDNKNGGTAPLLSHRTIAAGVNPDWVSPP